MTTKDNGGPAPLGEIFRCYERETNPVTKSVYRVILANRLTAIEKEVRANERTRRA